MATAANNPRQEAHELIDSMAPAQVIAVVGLLKVMLDPVSRSISKAPWEDEPISESENSAVAEAREWLKNNKPISNESLLAELGLTTVDFENMKQKPLESKQSGQ